MDNLKEANRAWPIGILERVKCIKDAYYKNRWKTFKVIFCYTESFAFKKMYFFLIRWVESGFSASL